jgi:ubiquinone/menaquinone biosynthesis C-methylase UbiE
MSTNPAPNADPQTIEGFGEEWSAFDQRRLTDASLLFAQYFRIFPWEKLDPRAHGFDLGCGSGRWAKLVSDRVGKLHCIDASAAALAVARDNLAGQTNCEFHHASVDAIPLEDGSMDFGYSLGVLHHVPNTRRGIASCVTKLKAGAPFLVYLYYAFDNRPRWFRTLWQMSDFFRRFVSRLPFRARRLATDVLAGVIYWPLARTAKLLENMGFINLIKHMPLSQYRYRSFYSMRTDSLDRFGTRLEQRFTATEIRKMMEESGLENIQMSTSEPFWCAVGFKRFS